MKHSQCPMCDFPRAEEREYSDTAEVGRRRIVVRALKRFVCPNCETVFTDESQSRQNLVATQLAHGEEPRFLPATAIAALRDELSLTQRECARVFGGGTNAFSKYETGEVTQSEPMDNLLWLASKFPCIVPVLAERRNIRLNGKALSKCGPITFPRGRTWQQEATVAAEVAVTGLTFDVSRPRATETNAEENIVFSIAAAESANEESFWLTEQA